MLIMKHASPRTFLEHYLPRQVKADTVRIICGLDPDVEMMRAAGRQNRWEDPRRPRYLTEQQRARIEDHPELQQARQQLREIRAQYGKTKEQGLLPRIEKREKEVQNTRKRLLRALRHQIRETFDEEQAFLDIEAQLSGSPVEEDSDDDDDDDDDDGSSYTDDVHPLLSHLLKSLLSYPVSDSLENEWIRRDVGTDAVMQYCDVPEGGPLRGRPKRETPKSTASHKSMPQGQDAPQGQDCIRGCELKPLSVHGKPLRATREYLEEAKQPEACFQCFANKGQPDNIRTRMFHDAGCVTRHFDAIHLNEEPLKCNWCEVTLLHRMAFQRHAIDEHRVRSRRRCPDLVNL